MKKYSISGAAYRIWNKRKWWQIFYTPDFYQVILTAVVEARNLDEAQEKGMSLVLETYKKDNGWRGHKCGVLEIK